MKKTLTALGLALALGISSATAGSLSDPVVAPEIIIEEASSSSAGAIVPLILLAVIVAAIALNEPAPPPVFSDARLKTDIAPVGTAANGLPLYQFRYIGQPTLFEGVMAQDVLTHTPEAVVMMPNGYMAVQYDMLGLEMRVIN